MIRRLVLLAMIAASPAQAQLCQGASVKIAADGRVLGHLPYGDAPPGELVDVPAGFALNSCQLRADVIPDLQRLLAAAAGDPLVAGQLRALSCHRAIVRQGNVFCRELSTGDSADRAISVAPPGHSEHATGYALDFAVRPSPNCPDAEACMAATPAFRWLVANAPKYGFETSFPISNKQNVKWEPWHWRWVGTTATAPGAARARALFARARKEFPANPAVPDPPIVLADVPAPPAYLTDVPVPVCKRGKCKPPKVKRKR